MIGLFETLSLRRAEVLVIT